MTTNATKEMDTFEREIERQISRIKYSCTPDTQDKIYQLGEQRGLERALKTYDELLTSDQARTTNRKQDGETQ